MSSKYSDIKKSYFKKSNEEIYNSNNLIFSERSKTDYIFYLVNNLVSFSN